MVKHKRLPRSLSLPLIVVASLLSDLLFIASLFFDLRLLDLFDVASLIAASFGGCERIQLLIEFGCSTIDPLQLSHSFLVFAVL